MYKLLGTWRLGRLVVMNMKKKKVVIIIILIALVVLITAGVINYISYTSDKTYVYDTNNIKKCDVCDTSFFGKRTNNSKKIKETHKIVGLQTSNMQITSERKNYNEASMSVKVKNISDATLEDVNLEFKFYNKKGEEISSFIITIPSIKQQEEKTISETTLYRIIDSYDYKINNAKLTGK